MKDSILDFFANSHTSFIHARGKESTDLLFQQMKVAADDKILEFGCGTGASVALASRYFPKAKLFGVDQSQLMLLHAISRNKSLRNVEIKKIDEIIPFEDHFFDHVYIESVLAILNTKALFVVLNEIFRVLKPGGSFVLNETIWDDNVSKETAAEINGKCTEAFDVIQSNADITHMSDWINTLESSGFKVIDHINLDNFRVTKSKSSPLPSSYYSLKGKLRLALNKKLKDQKKSFELKMKEILGGEEKLMAGVIFKTIRP